MATTVKYEHTYTAGMFPEVGLSPVSYEFEKKGKKKSGTCLFMNLEKEAKKKGATMPITLKRVKF